MKLVRITAMLSLVTIILFGAQESLARLGDDVVPTFQAIDLKLDANQENYSGSVTIDVKVNRATNKIQLHAEDMTLESITLGGKDAEYTHEHAVDEKGVLTITSEKELAPGNYQLEISFSNNFNTKANSLYRLDVDSAGYSFTQFEANEAREAFPCWDEPIFKIPFQMSLTVPVGHEAVSNTPFISEKITGAWKTVTFEKTPPLPVYLLAIATGTLEYTEIPGMSIPGRVVTVAGKSHMTGEAVRTTPPLLAAMEEYFGSKYPFKKLDLIAVPEFWAGAMENVGAITYRETLLLREPGKVSVAQKSSLARVTAHELAHMWFGDMVTIEWWDDLWLNESFATWMGNKITDKVYPGLGSRVNNARSASRVMSSDSRPSSQAIRRPVENEEQLMENIGAVYQKGHAVLGMFESWIGPDAFRQGVIDYLEAHKWGNARANDLFVALSEASGKELTPALSTFIEQAGVPLVNVELGLDGAVMLSQKRFSNFGAEIPESVPWHIPVSLKYYDGSSVRISATLLNSKSQTITLESDGPVQWVMPNADFNGYFRWSAPPDMLAKIAAAAPEHLTPRERIGYLGNLSALLDAGEISGGDYLKAVKLFGADSHPTVVRAALSGLSKVEHAFVTDELRPMYAAYVRHTLGPALKKFGLNAKSGEDETVSLIRPRLIATLAESGEDESVLAHCESMAKKYLEDPESVDPGIVSQAIMLSATRGDKALFDDYRDRFETTENPADRSRFLAALGHFHDSKLREEALDYTLNGPLRPQEVFTIPFSIASTSAKDADYIFNWMMENYEGITSKVPPMLKAFFPGFASGCSEERLAAAQEFFSEEEHQATGIDVQLAKVADQVSDCVNLREREGAAVFEYLSSIGK